MKIQFKIAIALAAALAFAAGAVALVFLVLMPWHFNPAPPEKFYPKPVTALDAQRQDLDYFRKLTRLDRSYSASARAEVERSISALERSNVVLPRPQFRIALMELVALADNGHTHLGYNPGAEPMELPVRIKTFSDGIYIMRASHANSDLLGGRVVAIDGHPIGAVMGLLERLHGGTTAWRELYAEMYLCWQDALVGVGVSPNMRGSNWTVATRSGAIVTRALTPYAPKPDEPFGFPIRWYSSEPVMGMTKSWDVYEPQHGLAFSLRDFESPFRRFRLENLCSLYVQFKSNTDEGENHIADFIAATERDMRANPPCNLILDLRFNTGGDYTNTWSFAHKLPGMVAGGGRIVMLTSASTFSAGLTTVAFVKEAAADRVVILGEPVGDRMAFFSEGFRGCLPNFPLCLSYRTGKHDYAHSCSDLDICYWLNYIFPVRVKMLKPDETITTSFADWNAGRDPVLERALQLARRR